MKEPAHIEEHWKIRNKKWKSIRYKIIALLS